MAIVALGLTAAMRAQTPLPLPGNPGNIFIQGQPVSVQLPAGAGSRWQAIDYDGQVVGQGTAINGRANLGPLPVGFFSLKIDGAPSGVTAAVVARLAAPTPANSPIGVDTAAGRAYHSPEEWKAAASLVALAGVGWERDRLFWREMQPENNNVLSHTRYDDDTEIMHNAGVHILDLIMVPPKWAAHDTERLPVDLRDVFNFYRALALKWRGTVEAMEPTNESDIFNSGAEVASFQKAAYLGLKAGNPDLIVGTNAWASTKIPLELIEFRDNDVVPYFDTINFHHYLPLDQLPLLYSTWRAQADGKPMWVSEFNMDPSPVVDSATDDPSMPDMKAQAQKLVYVYATSLFLNTQRSFFYVLCNTVLGGKQFGLLRRDMTPRPGYLALAAVGRLLAGARPMSQLHKVASSTAFIYAFHALPDGTPRDTLVAWDQNGSSRFRLPVAPVAIYDAIGRKLPSTQDVSLGQAPIFIVLPVGTVNAWAAGQWPNVPHPALTVPPGPAPRGPSSAPSPVVLQAVFPAEQLIHSPVHIGPHLGSASIQSIGAQPRQTIQLYAYNFSDRTQSITLTAQAPRGWKCVLPANSTTLPPNARVPIPFEVTPGRGAHGQPGEIKIIASGQQVADSVLAFHLQP